MVILPYQMVQMTELLGLYKYLVSFWPTLGYLSAELPIFKVTLHCFASNTEVLTSNCVMNGILVVILQYQIVQIRMLF